MIIWGKNILAFDRIINKGVAWKWWFRILEWWRHFHVINDIMLITAWYQRRKIEVSWLKLISKNIATLQLWRLKLLKHAWFNLPDNYWSIWHDVSLFYSNDSACGDYLSLWIDDRYYAHLSYCLFHTVATMLSYVVAWLDAGDDWSIWSNGDLVSCLLSHCCDDDPDEWWWLKYVKWWQQTKNL